MRRPATCATARCASRRASAASSSTPSIFARKSDQVVEKDERASDIEDHEREKLIE